LLFQMAQERQAFDSDLPVMARVLVCRAWN
jgi:hypothetical protein